jgi:hypothetical protein
MTDNANPTAAADRPAWFAWRRPRQGKWAVVATGQTEREASTKLFEVMDRDRGHHDSVVLTAGQEPQPMPGRAARSRRGPRRALDSLLPPDPSIGVKAGSGSGKGSTVVYGGSSCARTV